MLMQTMFISNGIEDFHYNLWNCTTGEMELALDDMERKKMLRQMDSGMLSDKSFNEIERRYRHLTGFQTTKEEINIPKGKLPWEEK